MRTIESIVAIRGWIIPTPLAIPVTVISTVPPPAAGAEPVTVAAFVTESVVRSASAAAASAASSAVSPPSATRSIAAVTRSSGSRAPMMPVERWRTWLGRQPSAVATAAPIAAWSSSPAAPVAAFAHARGRDDRLRVAAGRLASAGRVQVPGGQPDRRRGEAVRA